MPLFSKLVPRQDSRSSSRRTTRCILVALAIIGLAACPAVSTADDVAADWSATSNPSGNWSYGWEPTIGGAFNVYTNHWFDPGGWDGWGSVPGIAHSDTSIELHPLGQMTIPPYSLWLHPGPGGELSVVRWTVPADGVCQIQATFTGVCGYNGAPLTTTDVHVFHDSTELFGGDINVNGGGNTASMSATRAVQSGDWIDFMVGRGSDGDYGFDSTGLDAVVTFGATGVDAIDVRGRYSVAAVPNPTRGATVFSLNIPRASRVRVCVLDLAGRLVREVENDILPAGTSTIRWDGLDASRGHVASGLYFVRVVADAKSVCRRFVVTR